MERLRQTLRAVSGAGPKEILAAIVGLTLAARHAVSLPGLTRWPKLGWPVADSKELLAMTLISVGLAGFARIDISCLNWLGVAAGDIGNYFAAERIVAMTCLLPGLLAIAALPVFSRPEDAGHAQTVSRLRRELFLAGCVAGAVLSVFGSTLIPLVYGARFQEAARPLAWLGLALPFMFINHFSLIALIADKRSWHAAFAVTTAFTLNVLVDWIMIPRLGIMGAALGAVSAQAALSLLVWPFLSRPAR